MGWFSKKESVFMPYSGGWVTVKGDENIANAYLNNNNNAFQEIMAERQNQWNLDMWNKQNEYNSPSNQVQRLLDAGINPNNAVGNIQNTATSPAVGSPLPTSSAPTMQQRQYNGLNTVLSALGFVSKAAGIVSSITKSASDIQVNKANIANTMQGTQNLAQQTYGSYLANQWQKIQNQFAKDTYQYNISEKVGNLARQNEENRLARMTADLFKETYPAAKQLPSAQLHEIMSRVSKNFAERDYTRRQSRYADLEYKDYKNGLVKGEDVFKSLLRTGMRKYGNPVDLIDKVATASGLKGAMSFLNPDNWFK